jgi:hypothetical protein
LVVSIDIDGMPDELGLSNEHTEQSLFWGDDPAVQIPENSRSSTSRIDRILRKKLSLPTAGPDAETVIWGRARAKQSNARRAAEGLPPREDFWGKVDEERREMRVFLKVTKPQLERVKLAAPIYSARIQATVFRPEILQQVSLEPNERGTGERRSLRVTGLDDRVLKLVDTKPAFLRDGFFRARVVQRVRLGGVRTNVWTVNRVTGDIGSVNRRTLVPAPVTVGGIAIGWNEMVVYPERWVRNNQWVIKDPDWQKHTLLVVTADRIVGEFTQMVRSQPLHIHSSPQLPESGTTPEAVPETDAY